MNRHSIPIYTSRKNSFPIFIPLFLYFIPPYQPSPSTIVDYLVRKLEIEAAAGTCPPTTTTSAPERSELRLGITIDVIKNAMAAVDKSMKADDLEATVEKSKLLRLIEIAKNFSKTRALGGYEYADCGDFVEVPTKGLVIHEDGSVALLFKEPDSKEDVIKLCGAPEIVLNYPKNTPRVNIIGQQHQYFKSICEAPEAIRVALTEAFLKAKEEYHRRCLAAGKPTTTLDLDDQFELSYKRKRNQTCSQAVMSMLKGEKCESGLAGTTEALSELSLDDQHSSTDNKRKRIDTPTFHQMVTSQSMFMSMLKGTFTEKYWRWSKFTRKMAESLIREDIINIQRIVAYYRGVRQSIIKYRTNVNQEPAPLPYILKLWEAMEEQLLRDHLLRAQRIRLIHGLAEERNQSNGHDVDHASVLHFSFKVDLPPPPPAVA